jgi:cobaltochelatase CobN
MLAACADDGMEVRDAPKSSDGLMSVITAGPTNWLTDRTTRAGGVRMPLDDYMAHYKALPLTVRDQITHRWGAPDADPFFGADGFALSIFEFGNVCVGVQPARGYNIDPKDTYHSPDLVPPHNYLAFYFYLRHAFGSHGQAWKFGMVAREGDCIIG